MYMDRLHYPLNITRKNVHVYLGTVVLAFAATTVLATALAASAPHLPGADAQLTALVSHEAGDDQLCSAR
jgi:hypothetical protein